MKDPNDIEDKEVSVQPVSFASPCVLCVLAAGRQRRFAIFRAIMHPNAEKVQAELKAKGAAGEVVELAASTRTSREAAATIGTTVAQIAKSLVFLAGEVPVLVIASGVNRVSMEKLERILGGRAARPDADAVKRLTGFPIGGVAPVGHATKMRVLIDRDLLQYEDVWAAAGTPNAVFRTTPEDLARITGGEIADVREEAARSG